MKNLILSVLLVAIASPMVFLTKQYLRKMALLIRVVALVVIGVIVPYIVVSLVSTKILGWGEVSAIALGAAVTVILYQCYTHHLFNNEKS